MFSPQFSASSPLSLTISADARLSSPDYSDDQVWELHLGGGEPPALALETTYGLRAQRVRIFPRFMLNDGQRSDPASFYSPPRVVCIYPNYLAVTFFPFEELEVVAEYWIPESQVAAGRLRLTNQSILPLNFRLELAALLAPRDRQGSLSPIQLAANSQVAAQAASNGGQALAGETANLQPVLYMNGAPQAAAGPYPALALDYNMYPGNLRICTWAMAGLREQQPALEAAQRVTSRSWDAETARIELLHHSHAVQIETGNPDWDAALMMAQKNAFELFLSNRLNLPHPSFVLARRSDQGYSVRGDGADYPLMWAGQTALDAYYLASLLPCAPHLPIGVLRNFLAVQDAEGRIDWRPGLGGQRTRRLAQPMLASLAMQLIQALDGETDGCPPEPGGEAGPADSSPTSDSLLREVYPGLLRFFHTWFLPEHDADGDGIPEWENALQTGMDDSPIFDRFAPEPRGTDASLVESPGLSAMLYRECSSLIEMAQALGPSAETDLPALSAIQDRLRSSLDESWDNAAGLYHYRDYASHQCLPGLSMLSFQGSGQFGAKRRFKRPRRLVIRLEAYEERTYAAVLTITGYTPDGEVTETIQPRDFAWLGSQAHAVTQHTYLAIEQVEVLGLGPRDRGRVFAPDLTQEDCSLLLPLWAGACSPERARQLVETSLLPRFRRPFGIALTPARLESVLPDSEPLETNDPLLEGGPVYASGPQYASGALPNVSMLWNHLLGEGLLQYGYRAEAGALVESLLAAAVPVLKQQNTFRQLYHAENGLPSGERGHLHGIVPLGLFLQVLGIKKLGTSQILLDGFSPFTSPVTVQYRRVKLICHRDRTEVSVAGGTPVTVDRPGPHRLIL